MKLRNKKTGEIATVEGFGSGSDEIQMTYTTDNDETNLYLYCTQSLNTFNEEWEDYEEPKRHWIIDTMNDRVEDFDVPMTFNEAIGNYFETKEEAEKAVEKLKAWKRLKDKCNFRFTGIERNEQGMLKGVKVDYERKNATFPEAENIIKDLFLLFGGEE